MMRHQSIKRIIRRLQTRPDLIRVIGPPLPQTLTEDKSPMPRPPGHPFYRSKRWRKARLAALELYRYECQECKANGRLRRATLVHHDKPREDYPELALELFAPDGKPQLIPLCFSCHEKIEEERGNRYKGGAKPKDKPLTEEWW